MNWQEWYFQKAKEPIAPNLKRLLWDEIKMGCSRKQLEIVSKAVLDESDPTKVDWTRVRSAHLFIKHDKLSGRAALSAVSNLTRLASKGLVRKTNEWYRQYAGWHRKRDQSPVPQVMTPDVFDKLLLEIKTTVNSHDAMAVEALFCLSYYCGLKVSQAGLVRQDDFILHDGRTFLFANGRFIELPDHVVIPLMTWLRNKKLGHQAGKNPSIFRIEHRRVLSKYPKLHETYAAIRRMRG